MKNVDIKMCISGVYWIEDYEHILEFEIHKQLGSTTGFALDAHRQLGYMILPQLWQAYSEEVQPS